MKRIAIRVVPAVALLVADSRGSRRSSPDRAARCRARRMASGRSTPPIFGAASIRHSIRFDASNFSKIEVAWRFKTDNLGPRPETKLEGDAADGQGHDLRNRRNASRGCRARRADRRAEVGLQHGRGRARHTVGAASALGPRLSYWTDGKGDERVLYVTTGYRLVALNAKTGSADHRHLATRASSTSKSA